jgi:hypothetical protein
MGITQGQGLFTIMAFGFFTNFLSSIPWTFIFLFTQSLGIRLYTIKKKEECEAIQKNLGHCSHVMDGGKGGGYSLGYWYLASLTNVGGDDYPELHVWLVCTDESYKNLTRSREIKITFGDCSKDVKESTRPIKVMERFGSNTNSYYRSRMLSINVDPRPGQREIIDNAKSLLTLKKSAVILVHGLPNVGKTMVSLILANELNGMYCSTLAPWEPGDSLSALYNDAEPSKDKPLVIAFDEIDGPIQEIHKGVTHHKNIKTKVASKQGWNQMFDEIQMGFYPHLVIILTTNKPPSFFNDLDPSYIREHRVDKIYELLESHKK